LTQKAQSAKLPSPEVIPARRERTETVKIQMPTVAEVVALAITRTEFIRETPNGTTPREIYRAATIATNQAAESWEEDVGVPIGATVPDAIRHPVALRLVDIANTRHREADKAAEDALLDAIEAGDLDEAGEPIPYDLCRSA
jgi:hypothetical protein